MNNRQQVSDIGEYALVERIRKIIDHDPTTPLEYGDDAAAFILESYTIVANADMFVGSTDMPPGITYEQIGKKVVTMAVSDLAAKGVGVRGFLLSVGLPKDFLVEDFDQIIQGVNLAVREYGGWFLGGDINQANDLILDGIALGHGHHVIPRVGVEIGDVVFVTDKFGDTAAGLDLLLNTRTYDHDFRAPLVKAVYEPKAEVKNGQILASIPGIVATVDSSDGLARSLHILRTMNNVGIKIDVLPVTSEATHYANHFNMKPYDLVFYGGEEFHLVCVCRPSAWEQVSSRIPSAIRIGEIVSTDNAVFYESPDGNRLAIEDRGWEHLKPDQKAE